MRHSKQPRAVAVTGGRVDGMRAAQPLAGAWRGLRLNAALRMLFIGVRDEESSLSILRRGDARQMLRMIWRYVAAASRAAIDVGGTFFKTAVVTRPDEWPKISGLDVNMMPFVLGKPGETLPKELHGYLSLLRRLPLPDSELGRVGYLTIQESTVLAGATQRRPGLHTESPGLMKVPGTLGQIAQKNEGWGGGHYYRDSYEGGIFMASNVTSSLRVFNCRISNAGMIGRLGDLEHLRSFVERACGTARQRMVGKGEIVWLTDATPHEAVPLDAAVSRQFLRVVTSGLSVWHAAHCTPNPLGVVPGPEVRIALENKFQEQ